MSAALPSGPIYKCVLIAKLTYKIHAWHSCAIQFTQQHTNINSPIPIPIPSKEVSPIAPQKGKDCLPSDWTPIAPTQTQTLSGTVPDTCLRQVRSISSDADVYGFGQMPQDGLSTVGKQEEKLLATFSRNLLSGPSHAPAPFFMSVFNASASPASKAPPGGLAYGLFLNTHRYSMFDIGRSDPNELRIHSADPVMDYFLFAGPTPRDVLRQLTEVTGRPPLPPLWALGFKYHPKHGTTQSAIEALVSNFSSRRIPVNSYTTKTVNNHIYMVHMTIIWYI